MGLNLAFNLNDHGHNVVGYDRNPSQTAELESAGLVGAASIKELLDKLQLPRKIWIMVPAGAIIDQLLESLITLLNAGDIIIDGGNSNYRDTLRRYEFLREKGLSFVDVGTSGGIEGARWGACAMVGAEPDIFTILEPLFKDICVPNGYLHTGITGSGHFVKMVHNGIEYGMMQAMAEGFELLEKDGFHVDLKQVARVWNNGSVIRGWLMELMENALKDDPDLNSIQGVMHSSGEAQWMLEEVLYFKVPAPVTAAALFMRFRSEQDDSFAGKVVAVLRNRFGGHTVEKKE